ncbi:uncharacterized protein LOC141677717 [Apium graveolens]|uniref:uncharacterized protein LOC141677717 n=1 Tax=Apium graveolens TaxID=4045 RepID=UPI003D79CAB9
MLVHLWTKGRRLLNWNMIQLTLTVMLVRFSLTKRIWKTSYLKQMMKLQIDLGAHPVNYFLMRTRVRIHRMILTMTMSFPMLRECTVISLMGTRRQRWMKMFIFLRMKICQLLTQALQM